jgi:hypothetical protein
MSLPLRTMVFYKPKSLPHFGKLMQTNEVVALLGMRRLSRRCGWSFYTIQASDAQTKLIPVIRVGGRTQAVAYGVGHELKYRLRAGCIPVFSTDGLKPYSYAFIERINLTLRQDVSELARRSWGLAQFTPELVDHTEWWRAYYHFVRYNNSLKVELAIPIPGKGKQQPSRYRRRTPARQLA